MKPKLFVGSSGQSLEVAHTIQESLEDAIDVTVWDQDVFKPSQTTIHALLAALDNSDFGLFVLGADDASNSRGKVVQVPRDNVVFELGLFAGRLGMSRAFFIMPEDVQDLQIPSDLLGVTSLRYKTERDNLVASLGPACSKLRRAILDSGLRPRPKGQSAESIVITNPNEGSKYAATRVRSSSLVRVVGTARQEVLDAVPDAVEYLKAAEERAASALPFTYLRITSSRLSPQFRQHLGRLLQAPKSNPAIRVEISVEERMDASISYTIFENDELLLVVDNTVFGSVRDNRLMILFREPSVVKAFAEHFDHAWSRVTKKCVTKMQFDRATSLKK